MGGPYHTPKAAGLLLRSKLIMMIIELIPATLDEDYEDYEDEILC